MRICLTGLVAAGLIAAAPTSAATVVFEGRTYTDIGTPMQGALREETVGRFFIDPCGDTSDPAFAGCIVSELRPEDADFPSANPYFELLWSRPVGMRLFFEVLFAPRAMREEYTHSYTLGVTTGYWTDIGEDKPVVIWSSVALAPFITATISSVPVPAAGVLAAAGLGLLTLLRRRRVPASA